MKGPTPPRLHLELVSAKLLLPGAHDNELSLAVRLDRIERRMSIAGSAEATEVRPASRAAPRREASAGEASVQAAPAPAPAAATAPAAQATSAVTPPKAKAPAPEPGVAAEAPVVAEAAAAQGTNVSEVAELRRMWPNVLDKVKDYRRVTWAQLFEKSDVLGVDDKQLQIGLRDVGAHRAFSQGGHDEIVRQALIDVVGLDLVVVAVLDPSVAGSGPAPEPASSEPASRAAPPAAAAEARAAAAAVDRPVVGKERTEVDDDEVALDDADADDAGLAGPELIAQQLGGTVIGEIDHH
jgi:DNA polymerase-3 subunit gamma/tau